MQCLRRAAGLRSVEALSGKTLLKTPPFNRLLQTRYKGEYKPMLEQRTNESQGDQDEFELKGPGLKPTFTPSPIFQISESKDKDDITKQSEIPKPRKARRLKDSEKTYKYKSLRLKTSIKKLGALTRQIAQKDIDHAITQMKFSPKRQARNIVRALEHAKQEAIKLEDMKEGEIVVDQAWVGRDPFRRQIWPRARGRTNVRMRPRTHFTILLRPSSVLQERVEKVKKTKLESLGRRPSERKPIYSPRPYYTW